jgi:hypothetical protein
VPCVIERGRRIDNVVALHSLNVRDTFTNRAAFRGCARLQRHGQAATASFRMRTCWSCRRRCSPLPYLPSHLNGGATLQTKFSSDVGELLRVG